MYTKDQRKAAAKFFEGLDGHSIYSHGLMAEKFKKEVGVDAPWPHFSHAQTADAMEARGLGGTLAKTKERLCYGYSMAEAVMRAACSAEDVAVYEKLYGHVQGRGSRFRNARDMFSGL